MWKKILNLLPILILLLAGTANASMSAEVTEDPALHGCPPYYPFKEDNLRLIVLNGDKKITEHYFCSSYGNAKAKIEKDAKGISYVFLRHGEGRGTNARSEFLTIYAVSKNLIEYMRLPLSGPAGPFYHWHYEYDVMKPEGGGFSLKMKLKVEGKDPEWVPVEREKTIVIK
jgi:hypothetical protein